MKTTIIILVLALGTVAKTVAADTTSSAVLSKAITKPNTSAQIANPFAPVIEKRTARIGRLGNISSQPWSQIAYREANSSFMIDDPIRHDCQMGLFWIGREP